MKQLIQLMRESLDKHMVIGTYLKFFLIFVLINSSFILDVISSAKSNRERIQRKKYDKFLTNEFKRLERLGNLYEDSQRKKDNRTEPYGHILTTINPTFPCIRGVVPVGLDTPESINDGHKFACGVSYISSSPIVYSFGSDKRSDFEVAFYNMRNDSRIHIFEMKKELMSKVPPNYSHSIFTHHTTLGYNSKETKMDSNIGPTMSLTEIMKKLKHSYIDVLKMDIESVEFDFIKEEGHILKNVGQFLVEIHVGHTKDAMHFVELIESQGLRLFYKELNVWAPGIKLNFAELAFIQAWWGTWDENKREILNIR